LQSTISLLEQAVPYKDFILITEKLYGIYTTHEPSNDSLKSTRNEGG